MKPLLVLLSIILFSTPSLHANDAVNQQLQQTVTTLREAFSTEPYNQAIIQQQIANLTALAEDSAAAEDWASFALTTSIHAETLQINDQLSAATTLIQKALHKITNKEHSYQLTFQLATIYQYMNDEVAVKGLVADLHENEGTPPELMVALNGIIESMKYSPGKTFPAFSVQDSDGEALNLDDYKGKMVLINFFASWCMPCRHEMPNVVNLHQQYKDSGFAVIGVSLDRVRDDYDIYREEAGITWQTYFDGMGFQNILAQKYGVQNIPQAFLIDGDGVIIAKNLPAYKFAEIIDENIKAEHN
ncbi:MAG: TlpA family protein disulfide reductase [Sphaerospermopsis sp. SIO1G2]|nr:TlpA family protein disulfide reductase [Sphaerospermopsis sp. SIO1G2]